LFFLDRRTILTEAILGNDFDRIKIEQMVEQWSNNWWFLVILYGVI